MRKISVKTQNADGTIFRKQREMKYLLNLGIADLLNQAQLNEYDLPIHYCDPLVYPDYIALNTEKSKYHMTPATALGFYTFDKSFDKKDGLFDAIYRKDEKLLQKYKELYAGIKFVIAPDYSLFDDIWRFENEGRLLKIRIIMLWFVLEVGAVVIPNAVYLKQENFPMYLSGLENCTVMCFSTKGHIRRACDRERVKETVKYVVDNFPLKTILVYSVCGNDETSMKLFSYALEKGVSVIFVDNTMRRRNQARIKKEVL